MKITKRAVDSVEPSTKDIYIWDEEIKGFGLKVTPSARKVYIVQYRMGGRSNKTRRITMGSHGKLTAEQARKLAQKHLGSVASGVDPLDARDAKRKELSVREAYEEFKDKHILVKLKPDTSRDYSRIFEKRILPRFGDLSVKDITKQDMLRLHHELRDTPYRANCIRAVLSKFFNWCEQYEYRAEYSNPMRHVKKYKEAPRQRFLSPDELKRLKTVLGHAEKNGLASCYAVSAIWLLILTGARLREITTLKWEFLNFGNGTLELPDSKTGRKTIYLNEAAKDIISKIVRQADNPYIICGTVSGGSLINLQKPWTRIRSQAGLCDVRIHDLRHTFASVAAMGGMSLPMIGALLGHSQPQTTARYAHLAADPLREAAEMIGNKIAPSG